MMSMRDIAVSSGSACTSATLEPSHVLEACKVSQELLPGAVRFGLGRFNTAEEVDYVVEQVVEHAARLRELARRHPPH
jgi:cysteine desulfurase